MARRDKPTRTERRGARPAVYKRPYWFDRARSLSELHGWPGSGPGDGLGLIGRYTAAVNKPVGQLDTHELELLLTQHTDPHFLVPIALDLVRADGPPELLRRLIALDAAFWRTHPHLQAELAGLAERAAPHLAAAGNEPLAAALAAFAARTRRG